MNKKILQKLHLWLSLPLGIIISVICLSGATLVFKNEIRETLGMPRVVAPHGKSDNKPNAHGVTTKRDFFSYVTKFHTGLMMGAKGKIVVTYTTLLFVFILVSGIMMYLPRSGRQLRKRFCIEWKKGKRRLLFDLHVSMGWWVTIWLLLLAVTGLGFGLKLVPKGTELMQVFHQLHIGSWGGMPTKVITFIASLIGGSLPITGYWLYFSKHRQ